MQRHTHYLLLLYILAIFSAIPISTHAKNNASIADLNDTQQAAYSELLSKGSNLIIDWDDQYHIPDWIRMADLEISWRSDDYVDRSFQFFHSVCAVAK